MCWYWDHESWGMWYEFLVMEIAWSKRSNWLCNFNCKYFQCRMELLFTKWNWGQICSNLSLSHVEDQMGVWRIKREFWCSLKNNLKLALIMLLEATRSFPTVIFSSVKAFMKYMSAFDLYYVIFSQIKNE